MIVRKLTKDDIGFLIIYKIYFEDPSDKKYGSIVSYDNKERIAQCKFGNSETLHECLYDDLDFDFQPGELTKQKQPEVISNEADVSESSQE